MGGYTRRYRTGGINNMEPIKFYSTKGTYGCLSNFSRHGFSTASEDGVELWWKTSEHFFQAAKFFTTDREYAEEIRLAKTPKEAATLGRGRSKPLRNDWEEIKDDVMLYALLCKFNNNDDAHSVLLGTGDEQLIEDAPYDSYWGIGSAQGGKGKNMLGILLCETRSILRHCLPEDVDECRDPACYSLHYTEFRQKCSELWDRIVGK